MSATFPAPFRELVNEIVKEMLSFHVNSCRRRKENALFAYIIDGANKNATFFILVLYSKIGSICVNYRRTGKENAIFAYIIDGANRNAIFFVLGAVFKGRK